MNEIFKWLCKQISETIRERAIKLGTMKRVAFLYRYVRYSKLYYHNHCHIELPNQYMVGIYLLSKENVVNDENNICILLEFVVIGAVGFTCLCSKIDIFT